MPPIDWRQRRLRLGNKYDSSIDYCLDGMYDEIAWGVYYEKVQNRTKLFCVHNFVTVVTDFRAHVYSRICIKCRGIQHTHQFDQTKSEAWQVDCSRYTSRLYGIETCVVCKKRIITDGNIYVHPLKASDEAKELIKEYLPDVSLGPYGSGYVVELPIWVTGQLLDNNERRARKMLYRIHQHHCIDDSLFSETEGLRLDPYQRRLRMKNWKTWEAAYK